MNRDLLETQWPKIREMLITKFSDLTEEDIRQINGRYDQLVAKLQQRYGYSREEAEERIRTWNFDKIPSAKEPISMRDEPFRREDVRSIKKDNSSIYKWLLGLGIPLLLLGAYFLNTPKETEVSRAHTATNQQIVVETPADRLISNELRSALFSREDLSLAMQNIQITTSNGVVTLSGVVPDRETRDFIETTAKDFSGVRQVNNNLQIR